MRCAMITKFTSEISKIHKRRLLDQYSLVTMWRGSFCTTLWNNDFFISGFVGTNHLLIRMAKLASSPSCLWE